MVSTPRPSPPQRAATYRVQLYSGYHAHRDPMPPELAAQWLKAPALLESLGWTYATSEDLEADDVMFSHARLEEERGGRALLLDESYNASSASVRAAAATESSCCSPVDGALFANAPSAGTIVASTTAGLALRQSSHGK